MTPAADTTGDAEHFINHLFQHVDPQGWVHIFALGRDGERHVRWAKAAELPHLAAQTAMLAPTSSVWIGPGTRHANLGTRRGGDRDVAEIPALWVDLDAAGPHHPDRDDLPPTIDAAHQLLDDMPLPPTCVVHTGGGLQAWWMLTEPLPADEAAPLLERWGTTWQTLGRRRGWHVDNVFDLARIMRLPGTWNRKTSTPTRVEILAENWAISYGPDDIEPVTLDPPEIDEDTTARRVPYIGPERAGDAFNAVTDCGDLLTAAGFHPHSRDRNGDRHYRAPHRPDKREQTGATVYADDGHATIWSETACARYGLQPRRPYDAFGLYTHIHHHGDFTAASDALAAKGYGTKAVKIPARDLLADDEPGDPEEPPPWPDPTPLTAITNPPPFPTHVLPAWMAEHAASVAEELQVPADLPAMLGVMALSIAAAGRVQVQVRGTWREACALYGAVCLPPSSGKSPAFRAMLGPLEEWEADRMTAEAEAIEEAEQAIRIAEKRMKRAEEREDIGDAARARQEIAELRGRVLPRLTVDDATPEAVVDILHQQGGRLAIASPEGGLFDMMTGRYSDSSNLDPFLKAWSGDAIKTDRIGRKGGIIRRPVLTIALAVQPDVIESLAKHPELRGRGLTARFMYLVPPDLVGRRDLIGAKPASAEAARRYNGQLTALVDRWWRHPEPATLTMDADAAHMFGAWRQALEDRRTPTGDLRPLAEWTTKLESSVARLAGLLHMADRADPATPIGVDVMARAVAVGDCWLGHAMVVHDMWGADEATSQARQILQWAVDNLVDADTGAVDNFTPRDLWQSQRRRFGRAEAMREPLELLIDLGWIRTANGESLTFGRGKPGATLCVHPLVASLQHRVPNAPNAPNPSASSHNRNEVGYVGDVGPKGLNSYLSLSERTNTETRHLSQRPQRPQPDNSAPLYGNEPRDANTHPINAINATTNTNPPDAPATTNNPDDLDPQARF